MRLGSRMPPRGVSWLVDWLGAGCVLLGCQGFSGCRVESGGAEGAGAVLVCFCLTMTTRRAGGVAGVTSQAWEGVLGAPSPRMHPCLNTHSCFESERACERDHN